uniref:Zn(2)-C6 fungal-type domain-containing protein n=1 Tax=Hanusia phi TaxID=3032 RepID=A0A6T7MHU9_9CRYP|mmetsp:Transcript_13114/g.30151  ORF Transcript_13114/g.30151 Transcript_13114/m.30151 type:complete len:171 (+) Transcript_13114:38-550(+)
MLNWTPRPRHADPATDLLAFPPLEDAISHLVVHAEDLLSFMDFTEIEPENHEDELTTSNSPALKEDQKDETAVTQLAAADQIIYGLPPQDTPLPDQELLPDDKARRHYTKQACVQCKQKKQKCEEGRPCHRCINALRTCTDVAPGRRRRRRGKASRQHAAAQVQLTSVSE